MKKIITLILVSTLLTSCFPDDIVGTPTTNPYANKIYKGENTEYCRFDPNQDVFNPYILKIRVRPGYVREVSVNNATSDLTIDFSRTGRMATITGTVSITDQVEPKTKLFNLDITVRRIDLRDLTFVPVVCLGNNDDLYFSDDVRGSLTSLEDDEVLTIDGENKFYINESASYQNEEYKRGIILQINLNGIPTTGQIVLKD